MAKNRRPLNNLFVNFLKKKGKSDGGWAEVSDDDIDDLHEIMEELLVLKYEEDADGDLPIEFVITNRNTHESNNFLRTQYTHKLNPDEKKLELSRRMANVSMANQSLEQIIRSMEHDK